MEDSKLLSKFAFVFWLILFAACVCMTIFECLTIVNTYFQYPLLHQRQHVYRQSLLFPAVTLCSNNPANRLIFSQPNNTVDEKIAYFQEYSQLSRQFLLKQEPRLALLDALYNMSEAERVEASTSWVSLKLNCVFGHQNCFRKWYIHNSLFYGNCFTFNHVTDPNQGLIANDLIDLSFSFMNELVERIPDLNRRPSFIMVVHPVATAPVIHPSQIIDIAPGDEVAILVTQSIVSRLPAPYKSKCVDSTDLAVKNTTVYYRPNQEYVYSVDACLNTCIQRMRMEFCRCVDPHIPVSDFLLEKFGKTLPLCINKAGNSQCYIELLNETRCDCSLPCKETTLDLDIRTSTIANEDLIISHYNKEIPLRFSAGSTARQFNYSDGLRALDRERTLRSFVYIRFKSTSYDEITELPKLTASDFLGFIGGNVGLWLGMSVLSLFDIGKYFLRKFVGFCKLLKRNNSSRNATSPEKRIQKIKKHYATRY